MARILFHSLVFSPDNVSTAILVSELVRALKDTYQHQITVLTTTPHYGRDEAAEAAQLMTRHLFGLYYTSDYYGVPVIHITMPRKTRQGGRMRDYVMFHFWSLLLSLFLIGRQDVVITPSPPLTIGVIGWLLTLLKGGFLIYWTQELYPAYLVQAGLMREGSTLHKLFLWMEKFVYHHARYVTVITNYFREEVIRVGANPQKVVTIPNFSLIEIDRSIGKDNPLSRELGCVDKFVLTYAGNIGVAHSMDNVVDAITKLLDEPQIRFLIVGDGARRAFVEDEIRKRNLTNVTLLPYRPISAMAEVYATSDIGLVPLKRDVARTGLPSKVYTVMAVGLPVLAAVDLDSDMARMVQDADCGLVVPPDDPDALAAAIRQLYAQRDQIARYSENALHTIQSQYSLEAVAHRYHELITEAR
jgi:glycosyltransferase involved in cell wall biosynthesis